MSALKPILATLLLCGSASLAHAHPHDAPIETKEETTETKKRWPHFGNKDAKSEASATKRVIIKRMVDGEGKANEMSPDELGAKLKKRMTIHTRKLNEAGETLSEETKGWSAKHEGDFKDALAELENILEDSDMIDGLVAMVSGFANDIEIETTDDNIKVFKFDGETVGKMRLKSESKDGMMISGLGQNLNIERETFMKNGKTKTRIVIEMDGGEDVDIDLEKPKGLKRID